MTANEIRELSLEELNEKVKELKQELFNLKFPPLKFTENYFAFSKIVTTLHLFSLLNGLVSII